VPLAPITLIFGENSAGKSSILQCLNLLKQTLEAREDNAVLLPRAENGLVDLGSFQDILFDHDLKRAFSVRFTLSCLMPFWVRSQSASPRDRFRTYSVELKYSRPSLDKEVSLDSISLFSDEEHTPLATYRVHPTKKTRDRYSYRDVRRSAHEPNALKVAECDWITADAKYWSPFFELATELREEILAMLQKENERRKRGFYEEPNDKRTEKDYEALLKKSLDFFSREFENRQFIEFMKPFEMQRFLGLEGFCPVLIDRNPRTDSMFTLRKPRTVPWKNDISPRFASQLMLASQALVAALENLFPLGPFRQPPERWYVFSGTSPKDVGYGGNLLPALLFRNREVLKDTNAWLKRLDIGYRLKLRAVGSRAKDLFEVRLRDMRRSKPVEVSLTDVGYGISQLLPFVVQALTAQKQTITIEQPEVHIHPRLQADLGDLLAECIKEPRQNRFIIETHSEHLVLRLQRLVRTGRLKPEDVSILYVMHAKEGSEVRRLRVDDEGDFIDDWPGGFFPERLREFEG
jgi:hypothetical protein